MRPIIIVMLAVQAAMILVAVVTMVTARSRGTERRPIWSGIVIAMVLAAGSSWRIGERHAGEEGAELLIYGAPFLFGMALMGALFAIRRRRGLDGPPPAA